MANIPTTINPDCAAFSNCIPGSIQSDGGLDRMTSNGRRCHALNVLNSGDIVWRICGGSRTDVDSGGWGSSGSHIHTHGSGGRRSTGSLCMRRIVLMVGDRKESQNRIDCNYVRVGAIETIKQMQRPRYSFRRLIVICVVDRGTSGSSYRQ